jgi:protein involved in polysaccharide export with SLBB domain
MVRSFRWYVLLVVLSLVPGMLSAQMSPPSGDELVLSPGDEVQIAVFRKEELSGQFTINADGTIDHPLYRTVNVSGVPMSVVRQRLDVFLRGWEAEPYFLVKPLFRVGIGGEVTRPGLYPFGSEVTIGQAVASAGGVTARGRLDRVRVLRREGELLIDLSQPGTDASRETVRSGDLIIVEPTRTQAFRDYFAPVASLSVAAVTLLNILLR